MCMMCEEEAMYAAYLEWKAQKEREEAAAGRNGPKLRPHSGGRAVEQRRLEAVMATVGQVGVIISEGTVRRFAHVRAVQQRALVITVLLVVLTLKGGAVRTIAVPALG